MEYIIRIASSCFMSNDDENKEKSMQNWAKMVHTPFKKVVKFDLICMGIGAVMGIGFSVFLAK